MRFITALLFAGMATTAFAHHGSNGQFNHNIQVEVSGVITSVRYANPHTWVYFDVVSDAGEMQEWRCELEAASGLRRKGWTKEMFATGTPITINGSQARREEFGCFVNAISFSGGPVLARADVIGSLEGEPAEKVELEAGTPVIHGRWKSAIPAGRAARNYVPNESAVELAKAAWPKDVPQPAGPVSYIPSEAGKAAVGDFSEDMNPRFNCQATNIFHDWTFSQMINKIDQSDEEIIITYGFMDLIRVIHMDIDSHPDNISPSRAGHSIGRWEEDTLVVDTIGFEEGWLEARNGAVKHSEQMHTIETFDLSEDGQWLVMTYTINDPLYLQQPYTAQLIQGKTNEPYTSYDCVELTEERVEGF